MSEQKSEYFYSSILKAASTYGPSIFNLNPSDSLDISITAQRRRAINLAWSMVASGKVTDGSVVCVIGGGFGGTAFSSTLSLLCHCIIYLIDKEDRVLGKFEKCNYRFVSKFLNVNGRADGNSSEYFDDDFKLFQFEGGLIKDVVNVWRKEYQSIACKRPIIEFMEKSCQDIIQNKNGMTTVILSNKNKTQEAPAKRLKIVSDVTIIASGFGVESNHFNIKDYSYWESGYPLFYQPKVKGERVFISGDGDSGLIEVLHYALKGFRHEDINNYILSYFSPHCDSFSYYIRNTDFGMISENHRGYDSCSEPVFIDSLMQLHPLTLIPWYIRFNTLIQDNPKDKLLKEHSDNVQRIYKKMDTFFTNCVGCNSTEIQIQNYYTKLKKKSETSYSDFINKLKEHIEPEFSAIQSQAYDVYFTEVYGRCKKYSEESPFRFHLSDDFDITWQFSSRTIYSSSVSTPNLSLMYLLKRFSNVKFIQPKIKEDSSPILTSDGWKVNFEDNSTKFFDRVVTRHGLDRGGLFNKFSKREHLLKTVQDPFIASRHEEFNRKVLNESSIVDDINNALICFLEKDVNAKEKMTSDFTVLRKFLAYKHWPHWFHNYCLNILKYDQGALERLIFVHVEEKSGNFPSSSYIDLDRKIAELYLKCLKN